MGRKIKGGWGAAEGRRADGGGGDVATYDGTSAESEATNDGETTERRRNDAGALAEEGEEM